MWAILEHPLWMCWRSVLSLLIIPQIYCIYTTMQLFHKHTGLNTPLPSHLSSFRFSIRTHTCETFPHVPVTSNTHSDTRQMPIQHKFTRRGSCVEYITNPPDLKVSPPPQMWHQLVPSLALPLPPSSFLSTFISWTHLLTLQKVFLTCLSPLSSSTGAFFLGFYPEPASPYETYVLCRVNALVFASPWSW